MELAIGCPIPYWDVTFDSPMSDPTKSIVWTDKYFGNGYGTVKTGIMKGLSSPITLVRYMNLAGWLITKADVEMAMAKPSLHEFTEVSPCYELNKALFSWECFHKGVHDWIAGTMSPSNTTTFDPVFFTYHAYIDKIFEKFRQKLKKKGIDPSKTYPDKKIPGHEPEHKTIWVDVYPGLEQLTNRQCYGDELAWLTEYSVGPVCPHCSFSEDLYCNHTLKQCVSKERTVAQSKVETPAAQLINGIVAFTKKIDMDDPKRAKHFFDLVGALPFDKKFNIGSRHSRT